MSLGLVMLRVVAVAAWAQVGMPILARQETQRGAMLSTMEGRSPTMMLVSYSPSPRL